jgi:hypothetical protein
VRQPSLADFDPQAIVEHHITEQTLERVIRYVRLLQGEEYAGRFRLRPGLLTVESETHKEIRQQLWERIFAPPEAEPIPDAPDEERYVTRPAYHAVREAEEPGESQ